MNYIPATKEMKFVYFKLHFICPAGKSIIPHLLCYQGFAVGNYSVTLDALDLGYPQLSLN